MTIISGYYFFIKLVYFYSLVRILIRFDPMKDHVVFLGVIYAIGVAFLYSVFLLGLNSPLERDLWRERVLKTFLLSTAYFWLLTKFEEGVIFWTLLLLGILLVWF